MFFPHSTAMKHFKPSSQYYLITMLLSCPSLYLICMISSHSLCCVISCIHIPHVRYCNICSCI